MTRRMSSPSSSSSATAGARRSKRPSRNATLRPVAAALLAAATAWSPITFLFGPLAFVVAVVATVAALGLYLRVAPRGSFVPVLSGIALDLGALAVAFLALLVAGCGSPAGHVDDGVW